MKKKKQFVHPSRKGVFTEKAKKHGMGVQEFAHHVLANSDQYDTTTVHQATFAKNAKKFKHQAGGNNMPFVQGNTFATNAQEDAYRTNMLPSAEGWASTPQGQKVVDYYRQKGFTPSFKNDKVTFNRRTGIYDENPYVKDANILSTAVTGISNLIGNSRLKRREQLNVLDSIQPRYNENPDQYGLNNIPMYSQYGGSINGGVDYMGPDNSMQDWMYEGLAHHDFYDHRTSMYQYGGEQYYEAGGEDGMDYEPDSDYDDMVPEFPYGGGPLTSAGAKEILRDGTVHGHPLTAKQKRYFGWIAGGRKQAGGCDDCDHDYDSMMDDNDYDMMKAGGKWIQKAIKHPGRCSNPGDSRCPKGSPQYRLAMRFKHGDLHKKQAGGAIYDVGQFVDLSEDKMNQLRKQGYEFEPVKEKKKVSKQKDNPKPKMNTKSKNKFSIL